MYSYDRGLLKQCFHIRGVSNSARWNRGLGFCRNFKDLVWQLMHLRKIVSVITCQRVVLDATKKTLDPGSCRCTTVTRDSLLANRFYHNITNIISSQDHGFMSSSWIKEMSGHRVYFPSLTHAQHTRFMFTRSYPVYC